MHPLERLVNLVALLLETRRPLTFTEIREKLHEAYGQEDLGSAKRMFERDKDVLRDIGVPVEVLATDTWEVEEGYRIPKERYYLPDIEFTPEELSALFVAAQAPGEGEEAEQAVQKLRAAVGGSVFGPSERPLVAGPDVPGDRLLQVVSAIEKRRGIRFRYRPARGDPGERTVDPYGLVWRAGHWYVVGLDRDRGEIRSFRMSRLLSGIREGSEASSPPEGFDAREHLRTGPWGVGEPDREARVSFAPDVEWWATRDVPGARRVKTAKDGWVEVALPASTSESFVSWVLSFGPAARVIEPADVRLEVTARLEAVVAAG